MTLKGFVSQFMNPYASPTTVWWGADYHGLDEWAKYAEEHSHDPYWGIVDPYPTPGSPNPVSSDGVYKTLLDYYNKWQVDEMVNGFVTEEELTSHTHNSSIHVTQSEKEYWDSKMDRQTLDDYYTKEETDSAITEAVQVAFEGKVDVEVFNAHTGDTDVHVTVQEKSAWNDKQDKLSFDDVPTSGSSNPVTSEGLFNVFSEIDSILDEMDSGITEHTANTVVHITQAEREAWNAKQEPLVFDEYPMSGSTNPVESNGIFEALMEKTDEGDFEEHITDMQLHFTEEEKEKLEELEDDDPIPYADIARIIETEYE